MTIAEMKRDSLRHGSLYFSKETMEFWGSKVLTPPDQLGLFIESIDNWNRDKKIYCVKSYNKRSGEIVTFNSVSEERCASLQEAKALVKYIHSIVNQDNFSHFEYGMPPNHGFAAVYSDGSIIYFL